MYTQCPECSVAFRVTAEVLKMAAGQVRCGGCGVAFNALEHLSETKPAAPPLKKELSDPDPPELRPDEPAELEAGIDDKQKQILVATLAFEAAVRMNAATPITATAIVTLILLAGGLFLLYKAVHEIHHTVEFRDEDHASGQNVSGAYAAIITQIVLLDIVFSVDSVITAVGLTQELWIIVTAVVLSFVGILFFARPIGDFILQHPALKILALSFLITIGVTIFMEGLHKHVPKAYIYLPMGFALMVEMLQMRYEHNRRRRKA